MKLTLPPNYVIDAICEEVSFPDIITRLRTRWYKGHNETDWPNDIRDAIDLKLADIVNTYCRHMADLESGRKS
jgi:hypothetical protein